MAEMTMISMAVMAATQQSRSFWKQQPGVRTCIWRKALWRKELWR